jgi:PEGA domain
MFDRPSPFCTRSRSVVALLAVIVAAAIAYAPRPAVAQSGDEPSASEPREKKSRKKPRRSRRGKRRPKPEPAAETPKVSSKADREADRHFKTGVELFDERKYAEALAEFEQAYALKPHPLVLNNLAATHRALSQYDQAVDFYNRFLIEGEGKLTEAELAAGRAELEDLLRLVARVEVVTSPEGATVKVDGRSMGDTPLDDPLVLGPGDHTVVATLSGHLPAERKIRVAAGDSLRVEFALRTEERAVATVTPTRAQPAAASPRPAVSVVAQPRPALRRFSVNASYGANALEVSETGAPVVGVGFALTSRFSVGVDVVVTALSAVPAARFRLFGDTLSLHAIAAVPVTFRDDGVSETFAAAAGGLGVRWHATGALALRVESWVSYAGSEHGTTVPTFAGAEVWF